VGTKGALETSSLLEKLMQEMSKRRAQNVKIDFIIFIYLFILNN
jgi:hypothetical protein